MNNLVSRRRRIVAVDSDESNPDQDVSPKKLAKKLVIDPKLKNDTSSGSTSALLSAVKEVSQTINTNGMLGQ